MISPVILPADSTQWLITVSRVLLRLLVPRHSPCALCSLTNYVLLRKFCFANCRYYPSSIRFNQNKKKRFDIYRCILLFSFQGAKSIFASRKGSFKLPSEACRPFLSEKLPGRLKCTRTTDLALIRRAL